MQILNVFRRPDKRFRLAPPEVEMMTREIVTNGVNMVPRDSFLAAVCSCRHFTAAGYVFRKVAAADATAAM